MVDVREMGGDLRGNQGPKALAPFDQALAPFGLRPLQSLLLLVWVRQPGGSSWWLRKGNGRRDLRGNQGPIQWDPMIGTVPSPFRPSPPAEPSSSSSCARGVWLGSTVVSSHRRTPRAGHLTCEVTSPARPHPCCHGLPALLLTRAEVPLHTSPSLRESLREHASSFFTGERGRTGEADAVVAEEVVRREDHHRDPAPPGGRPHHHQLPRRPRWWPFPTFSVGEEPHHQRRGGRGAGRGAPAAWGAMRCSSPRCRTARTRGSPSSTPTPAPPRCAAPPARPRRHLIPLEGR